MQGLDELRTSAAQHRVSVLSLSDNADLDNDHSHSTRETAERLIAEIAQLEQQEMNEKRMHMSSMLEKERCSIVAKNAASSSTLVEARRSETLLLTKSQAHSLLI